MRTKNFWQHHQTEQATKMSRLKTGEEEGKGRLGLRTSTNGYASSALRQQEGEETKVAGMVAYNPLKEDNQSKVFKKINS